MLWHLVLCACIFSVWARIGPMQATNTSNSHITNSLKMYNREGYLYTNYMCSPAHVQHAYNDIILHNTKLHKSIHREYSTDTMHLSMLANVVDKRGYLPAPSFNVFPWFAALMWGIVLCLFEYKEDTLHSRTPWPTSLLSVVIPATFGDRFHSSTTPCKSSATLAGVAMVLPHFFSSKMVLASFVWLAYRLSDYRTFGRL